MKRKKQKKKKEDNYNETTNRNNNSKNGSSKNKTNIYILGNRMVKLLNGYLLTRKFKHKHLIKVYSFSGAKISCMTDHVKPTLRDMNLDHIVLHARTNNCQSYNRSSDITEKR